MNTIAEIEMKNIDLAKFLKGEPLSQLIILRWKLKPWSIFFVVITLNLLIQVLPGYALGFWNTTPKAVGVIDDWPNLVITFLVVPINWALFVWLPPAIAKGFDGLQDYKILQTDDIQKYQAMLRRLLSIETSVTYRLVAVISSVIITSIAVYVTLNFPNPPPWFALGWYFWLINLPREFLNFYVFVNAVLWCILITVWLFLIFREFKINVFPYHEDSAGGLRFIGQMIFGMSRISIGIGLFFLADVFGVIMRKQSLMRIDIIAELIAFPLATIVIFVVPIIICRKSMIRTKEASLKQISDQIQNLIEKLTKGNQVPEDMDNLLSLINFRSKLNKEYPTLPVDTSILQGFTVRLFGSFLPAIFGFGMDIYKILS